MNKPKHPNYKDPRDMEVISQTEAKDRGIVFTHYTNAYKDCDKEYEIIWVTASDNMVCEAQLRSKLSSPKNNLFVCRYGRFSASKIRLMPDEPKSIRRNAWFSGGKSILTDSKKKFAKYFVMTGDFEFSYKMAYPSCNSTGNEGYIKKRANVLLKDKVVMKLMDKEIKTVMADIKLSPEWILKHYMNIVEDEKTRVPDKKATLDRLCELTGLEQKVKAEFTQSLTVEGGIDFKMLHEMNKQKLVSKAHQPEPEEVVEQAEPVIVKDEEEDGDITDS